MATAGDGMTPSESGGARKKFRNLTGMSSDEGENSASIHSDGISELEQRLKQETVSRFNIQRPTTLEDLPGDLLTNIFIHLLARQLAQMRTVSKFLNAFLSDPSFVKSHRHRSIHNNNQQILMVFPGLKKPFTEYSCKSLHLEPTNVIKHTPSELPMNRVIGAVNGLICLSELYYSNIHIWNPSLSAMSAIPPPHSLSDVSTTLTPYHIISISIRLGFDPKTDDYKLVKIEGVIKFNEWLPVEVYSMRKGCWKFITQPFPSHITEISDSNNLFVDGHDGHLHWQIETAVKTEETIVAFDLGSETFREIPLPNSILDSNHRRHQLGVLGGKLCEMSWRRDGACELWVMEEYGDHQSWAIRHFSPQFYGDWRFAYGFTSSNELLIKDKDNQLVLYDLIANKTKVTRTEKNTATIVEYMDSLVWV